MTHDSQPHVESWRSGEGRMQQESRRDPVNWDVTSQPVCEGSYIVSSNRRWIPRNRFDRRLNGEHTQEDDKQGAGLEWEQGRNRLRQSNEPCQDDQRNSHASTKGNSCSSSTKAEVHSPKMDDI
jgi:hypothetical protein